MHISRILQTLNGTNRNGNFRLFPANGNGKLPFLCLLQTKTEKHVCIPWSANNKRQWTIAVSANMPVYVLI
jgi:hypothetical protein